MDKLITNLEKQRTSYEVALKKLEERVREVCDFDARITWCSGDGHLILNKETSNVANLSCLKGKNKRNKLTEVEHLDWCI